MNSCHFIGRFSREPEAKKAQNGTLYCQFDLAVHHGNKQQAHFIHCIAYEKLANAIGRYSHKGDKVGVSGHLINTTSTTKEGFKVEKYLIVCDEIDFISKAKRDGADTVQGDDSDGD